jgi:hypothetical protein
MSQEDFAKRLESLMKESGYQSYGTQHAPVQQKHWPTMKEDEKDPSQVTPGNPPLKVVPEDETPGETVVDDMEAQSNDDVAGAISSLFISMGYILQQAGVLEDKYDTDGIISFLGDLVNNGGCDAVEVDYIPHADDAPQENPEASNGSEMPPMAAQKSEEPAKKEVLTTDEKKKHSMTESRQLLESRIKAALIKKK